MKSAAQKALEKYDDKNEPKRKFHHKKKREEKRLEDIKELPPQKIKSPFK